MVLVGEIELKVRILGYHPDDDVELTNEQLPWAHVFYHLNLVLEEVIKANQ